MTDGFELGKRVVVTGLAGSGKSTFSHALGARSGLPVIHLDLEFWKPGWVAPTPDEWREKQHQVLAGDAWIADGNYHETLDLRIERADTIVVLDTPWPLCVGRALLRAVRRSGLEMPDGCDDSPWRRLRDEVGVAGRVVRKRRWEPDLERDVIARHGQHAAMHVLGSKAEVSAFLDRVDRVHRVDVPPDAPDPE